MKAPRMIWPVLLLVTGFACYLSWLPVPPQAPQARIRVEEDNVSTVQTSTAHPVSSYDYYYIPQNRTPEVAVTLKVEFRDLSRPLNSTWGRKYE